MTKKLLLSVLAAVLTLNSLYISVFAKDNGFELIETLQSENLGGTIYRYRHKKTGAEVVYNDNNSDKREFILGFKTPPVDSKGANHVLEHALFCGSEKYPTKNIMHYIQNGTSSLILNGFTADDCTYYMIMTQNKNEYYNMIDVYMNGIFHPLFLRDENIFRQQGIRIEYANGKAQYNGIVYNELRIKNLNTEENSINFLSDKMYRAIYGDTTPVFSAGGELDEIKNLTYDDLLRVYNTFYIPSNSMTYLSGNQDLDKTLDILNGFFSENTAKAPEISFEDTKQIPAKKIQEYNIDENTKTVDIGFMFSGVNAAADAKDRYANEIIYDIIRQKMEDKGYSNMYTVGGNTGGVSALGLMVSRVPIEDKDKVIADHSEILSALAENGINGSEIDMYIDNDDRYFFQDFDRIMIGLLYKDNPLAYTEVNSLREYYREHKEYFEELLKKYFTENPYHVTVISGNGAFGTEDSSVNVSAEELDKIKRDTEEFQKWNDEKDDPAVIAKIPFLTLEEVKDAPAKAEPEYEEESGIKFYHTNNQDNSLTLYFPLDINGDELEYACLMQSFLQSQAENQEMNFYSGIMPFENADNSNEINPHFLIGIDGENPAGRLNKIISWLQSAELWNANDLSEYLKTMPKQIFNSYYDPYFLSSDLKDSALSAGGRFSSVIPLNTIVKGSPRYYRFLQELDTSELQNILSKIENMAYGIIINGKPISEYMGENDEYSIVKNTVCELYKNGKEHKSSKLNLPVGCNSAATITQLADANHFMLTASYERKEYSGKMAVLGNVLTTKYIYPTMRGKYGAYGCNIRFDETSMTSAVTGLQDIDFAIELWNGMGDYLRNMDMTQNELNSFIVSAVQGYDEWEYMSSENGADFALKKKSAKECEKIRNEMLMTTVDDIKSYADFVDELVNQKRVFAVLGKAAADSAHFDFAYYGNGDTLEVTPCLTKNPKGYISGKTDGLFCPDDNITRAETAAMISRIIADTRKPLHVITLNDVTNDSWYYDDVSSLCEKEIMSGYGDNTFNPDENITRAEFASVMSKFIFGGDTAINAADIQKNSWYADAVGKMINEGYISGYGDGTFRPDDNITRAEAVSIINRMLGLTGTSSENPFKDLNKTHWAYNDILAALK